eukprot:TRINITY_DN5557_c0_g1_i1.p1 TRINITY_DN5557_c0_g1~~TRINITY_DN5557_c0_g1_i1.p1  ORF type:complete len:584 (-),score=147.57 TRINITY_DN5557_c0_g1_i1:94-1845(-)
MTDSVPQEKRSRVSEPEKGFVSVTGIFANPHSTARHSKSNASSDMPVSTSVASRSAHAPDNSSSPPIIGFDSKKEVRQSIAKRKNRAESRKQRRKNNTVDVSSGLDFGFRGGLRDSIARHEAEASGEDEDGAVSSGEFKADSLDRNVRSLSDNDLTGKQRKQHEEESSSIWKMPQLKRNGKMKEDSTQDLGIDFDFNKKVRASVANRKEAKVEDSDLSSGEHVQTLSGEVVIGFDFAQTARQSAARRGQLEKSKLRVDDSTSHITDVGLDFGVVDKINREIQKEEETRNQLQNLSLDVNLSPIEREDVLTPEAELILDFGFSKSAKKSVARRAGKPGSPKDKSVENVLPHDSAKIVTHPKEPKLSERKDDLLVSSKQLQMAESNDVMLDFGFTEKVRSSASKHATVGFSLPEDEEKLNESTRKLPVSTPDNHKVEHRDESGISPTDEVWVFDFEQQEGHWNSEEKQATKQHVLPTKAAQKEQDLLSLTSPNWQFKSSETSSREVSKSVGPTKRASMMARAFAMVKQPRKSAEDKHNNDQENSKSKESDADEAQVATVKKLFSAQGTKIGNSATVGRKKIPKKH